MLAIRILQCFCIAVFAGFKILHFLLHRSVCQFRKLKPLIFLQRRVCRFGEAAIHLSLLLASPRHSSTGSLCRPPTHREHLPRLLATGEFLTLSHFLLQLTELPVGLVLEGSRPLTLTARGSSVRWIDPGLHLFVPDNCHGTIGGARVKIFHQV